MNGHCICGAVTYRLTNAPLFVNCCHCTWCQRETGSSFALNATIETECVEVMGPVTETVIPSASGKGQIMVRCPTCKVVLYSHYAGAGRLMAFVRAGTLTTPIGPDIHIYTSTKHPWVILDTSVPVLPDDYDRKDYWPEASLQRRKAALARATP